MSYVEEGDFSVDAPVSIHCDFPYVGFTVNDGDNDGGLTCT